MGHLKYRVRQDGAGYVWEVFADDGRPLAKGVEVDSVKARAAALAVGMRELKSSQPAATASQ